MKTIEYRQQKFRDFEGKLREEILFSFTGVNCEDLFRGKKGPFFLCFNEKKALLSARLFEGTLKYFFPDPENYFYLPAEDRAVHSSVAVFVPKDRRKKATRYTACEKQTDLFLPIAPSEEVHHPNLFRETPKSFPAYIKLSETTGAGREFWEQYLLSVLELFKN